MDVEEINLDFTHALSGRESYVFPASHFLDFEKNTSFLKHCFLKNCHILPSLSSFVCRSWLRCLTTLHLSDVPLHQSGVECILSSGGLHLTSLALLCCDLPRTFCIDGQLICLKKLVIEDELREIKLSCPNLEEFEYFGRVGNMKFAHIPKLRKAEVLLYFKIGGCSLIFDDLTRKASQLEALSLNIPTEVKQLPVNIIRARLRKLDLRALISYGFDILTLTYMLNASPFLEIFNLEFGIRSDTIKSRRKEYPERRHLRLKEVKLTRFGYRWIELALYLLRNAVALEQMVIEIPDDFKSEWKEKITTTLMQNNFNPRTQVIIRDWEINK